MCDANDDFYDIENGDNVDDGNFDDLGMMSMVILMVMVMFMVIPMALSLLIL